MRTCRALIRFGGSCADAVVPSAGGGSPGPCAAGAGEDDPKLPSFAERPASGGGATGPEPVGSPPRGSEAFEAACAPSKLLTAAALTSVPPHAATATATSAASVDLKKRQLTS